MTTSWSFREIGMMDIIALSEMEHQVGYLGA